MAATLLRLCLFPLAISALAINPAQLQRRAGIVPSNSGSRSLMSLNGLQGRYPRANYLQDGSLIGAYVESDGADSGNTTIKIVKSSDNGNSWYGNVTGFTRFANESDIDNPYILQIPCGKILLINRNHDRTNNGPEQFFRLTISVSTDNGRTWAVQGDAVAKPQTVSGFPDGIWEPILRNALDGSLQLYYSEENNATDQDSKMRTSTDEGMTWSDAQTISGADTSSTRDGMLGVSTTTGTNVLAVFEVFGETAPGTSRVDSVSSPDDGKTWGNRQVVYTPNDGDSAGAPQLVNIGGTMVVSFSNSNGPVPAPYNGSAITILTSADGGNTWGNEFASYPTLANEAGMVALNDNSSLLVMASTEPAPRDGDDGTVVAQKVVLS